MNTSVFITDIVIGIFLPGVITFLIKKGWSRRIKTLVALGVAIVAALVVSFVVGDLTGLSLAAGIPVVFASSQVLYNILWKGLLASDKK